MKIDTQLDSALRYLDEGLRIRAERVTTLASSPNIGPAIAAWIETRNLIDKIKRLKAQADALNDALTDQLIPQQLDWHNTAGGLRDEAPVPHALGRVEIRRHVKASILPDRKPQAYDWLQSNDLGGIIIQTVNAQTLGATAKDLLTKGKDLPPDNFVVSTRRYAAFVEDKDNATQPPLAKRTRSSARA